MSPLRILALHGCGTSADIWRAQSASLRSHLPADWKFDFLEGEEFCEPADGVDEVYPGPYYCYYSIPTYGALQVAHALVHDILEEDGPFDAVIGFSQGAALAASVILHHQHEEPFAAPLFRFAVFINASLPFSKTSKLGLSVSHIFSQTVNDADKVVTPTDDDSTSGLSKPALHESLPIRRFSPRAHKCRISIPTTHVYGKLDPYRMQSLRLASLCTPENATCLEHPEAHVLPKTREQSSRIAMSIIRTYEMAQFVSA